MDLFLFLRKEEKVFTALCGVISLHLELPILNEKRDELVNGASF